MAAPISNDRKKAARARNLILDEVIRLFESDPLKLSETEHGLKKELLLRMAANTLPRLTEITGEDGDAIQVNIVKYDSNNTTSSIPAEAIPTTNTPSV